MRTYRNYTDRDVIDIAKKVSSMAGLLKELNLKLGGGTQTYMKKVVDKLGVDISHWKGPGWNKGLQLKKLSEYTQPGWLRKHLIRIRGHQCEDCKHKTWMGKKIPLELHHKDGNKKNNLDENLKLLCCNCHALTKNWRRKKILVV